MRLQDIFSEMNKGLRYTRGLEELQKKMYQKEWTRFNRGQVNAETVYDGNVREALRSYSGTNHFCGYTRTQVNFGAYSFPAVKRTEARVRRAKVLVQYVELLQVLLDDVVMVKPKNM